MKIDRISYYETLELPGAWKKIGAEASLTESDDIDDAFKTLQQTVAKWHSMGGAPRAYERVADEKPIPIKEVEQKKLEPFDVIANINSCTDVKVLETYKYIARGNKSATEAYNQKFEQL